MSQTVYVKNQAKEKFLLEVIREYEDLYPVKAAYYRKALGEMRKVTKESSIDAKGREMRVTMRVPTEPFLFIQSLHPDFGKDSADIELLVKLWGDYANPKKDRRKHSRLHLPSTVSKE